MYKTKCIPLRNVLTDEGNVCDGHTYARITATQVSHKTEAETPLFPARSSFPECSPSFSVFTLLFLSKSAKSYVKTQSRDWF